MISDALDSDPFELMRVSSTDGSEGDDEDEVDESVLLDKKKNREMIDRIKVSCRCIALCKYICLRACRRSLHSLISILIYAEYDECHIM